MARQCAMSLQALPRRRLDFEDFCGVSVQIYEGAVRDFHAKIGELAVANEP
ncbi:hypothetical protein [Telmatospirillum sp.]|uniref:hypothetical protein n=1 Tax=Telmatospirillum sp. TaxID=2079197 RepID=UPI002851C633|nr:hypothetical protein [Telmatospirillum sp.]MDR3435872.1 hypothetical protein [Telmatospirillum sp.]